MSIAWSEDMQRAPTGGLYDLKHTLDRLLEGFADELSKRFSTIPKAENNVDADYHVQLGCRKPLASTQLPTRAEG
eukprot:2024630-Amphidinium_carterae.1